MAAVQINWQNDKGMFISTSLENFKVTHAERGFHLTVVAPHEATHGTLYVTPGGKKDVVRYTEMSVIRLEPIRDFMSYEFAGVKGQTVLVSSGALLLLALLYSYFRTSLFRTGALLIGGIGGGIVRVFPLLALLLCGTQFAFLEGFYEQHYDSSWHQAVIDSVMQWNEVSLDMGGNVLHNLGIQHVMKPQLSPNVLIANVFGANHRIQVEGSVLAMALFAILTHICRLAGARLGDACAISLIAVLYFWIPDLSDHAITLNATLGLKWQAVAIATLLGFFCFTFIGYGKFRSANAVWPIVGLAVTILWVLLAYTETIAFFTLATSSLCLGALIGVESRRELLYKLSAATGIIGALLAVGVHSYVLNLFLYTPQMYYKTLYNHDFTALFFNNTSLLLASRNLGGIKVVAFFVLAATGAFLAWRFGNHFARRMVFGGLMLEVAIHLLSAINSTFKLVPLTFIYVEQMGLSVVALLTGTAIWAGLRVMFRLIPKIYNWIAPRGSQTSDLVPSELRSRTERTFPYLVLLLLVGAVFYRLAIQINFFRGWPPRTDSAPAQIQARELAVKPGDNFKGKVAVLLGMGNQSQALWGQHFFPVVYYKYREELGNDLMNDAEAAGIPVVNEYGHWISPPMLALFTAAFYRREDHIDRAAQAPRVFRPNLARLLGVSLVVSDQDLPEETELYHGQAGDHPISIHRVANANLGQYSPTSTVVAITASQILDQLQAKEFDGHLLAIVEQPVAHDLVPAEQVSVSFHKGPRVHIAAYSKGTSLLVLPFDYSHCLEVEGEGLNQTIPVNLAQTGLVVHGKVSLNISYRYGLINGTTCRKKDLERIKRLQLEDAATGRLFHDARPTRSEPKAS